MTASLAIQDRKKSTTSDKVYGAILCCDMKCSVQDKSDLQGKSNHQDQLSLLLKIESYVKGMYQNIE
jgi:hypothetical protein